MEPLQIPGGNCYVVLVTLSCCLIFKQVAIKLSVETINLYALMCCAKSALQKTFRVL